MPQSFTTMLEGRGPASAWVFMPIPFDVTTVFGVKGQVRVTGTINGIPFSGSLMPEGDGTHAMPVNKELRARANVKADDTVDVVLERDVSERVITIPPELATCLETDPVARDFFASLSYSHRKEYADWIGAAKQAETRSTRSRKALERLREGKKFR